VDILSVILNRDVAFVYQSILPGLFLKDSPSAQKCFSGDKRIKRSHPLCSPVLGGIWQAEVIVDIICDVTYNLLLDVSYMSKRQKLIEKIKDSPKKIRFEELDKVLLSAGFQRRQPSKGSSHFIYTIKNKTLSIPYKRPYVKVVHVKKRDTDFRRIRILRR